MKLSSEQLSAMTLGAAYVTQEDGAAVFHRFTREQEALYQRSNEAFFKKCFAAAGIKLSFSTDSPWLRLKGCARQTMPRTYYSIDILSDGEPVDYIDNFSHLALPEDYTTVCCTFGSFERQISLGEGTKHITVHLPWSAQILLEELSLADGSTVTPVRPARRLLLFGDSITQGYDALRPSRRYAAGLARALDAEEYNRAIGGEVFFPPLAQTEQGLQPDYITVAYGTNDWSTKPRAVAQANAEAFLQALRDRYPEAKLAVLLPIWRKDREKETEYGSFDRMRQNLREIAHRLGLAAVDCYDFVPEDPAYFADLRLHPNDSGFACYTERLALALEEWRCGM